MMHKPFQTHKQLLKKLRGRGMTIKDGSKAIRVLKREGYYNVINGYKDIFLDRQATLTSNDDRYLNGVSFDHLYALYDFDRNLRSILIRYILKTETNVKTKISYYFPKHYKQNFSYLDINNFDSSNPQKVTQLISKLSKVITDNSKDQDGPIFHYIDKYKELPLWVLFKKTTLGETYHFFEALTSPIKNEIVHEIIQDYSHEYPLTATTQNGATAQNITEMLRFLNDFRNICAHGERLYSSLIKHGRSIPRISLFHKPAAIFNSRLFDCVLILGLFITKKDYKNLVRQFSSEIDVLQESLQQNHFNAVLIKMGFPSNWPTRIALP